MDDELSILNDMFGANSPALQEQLGGARQAALEQTFAGHNPGVVQGPPALSGKSAAEAAETLLPEPGSELIHEMDLPELESPPTGKIPEMPALEDAPGRAMSNAANVAEAAVPEVEAGVPSLVNSLKAMPKEQALSTAEKIGGSLGKYLRTALGGLGEDALGPLAVGYEALKSAKGPEGLQDYSPSTIALINAKKDGTPPPTPPSEPSLFDSVHNKYQDLQKEGKIGEPPVPTPAPQAKTKSPSSPMAAPPAPVKGDTKDYLKDLIGKLYGGMGDEDMKNAQADRNQMQTNALISKAGSQLGSAISRGVGGNLAPDTSVQDALLKQADQPVEDINARRKAVLEKLEGGLKASDLVDHEKLRDAGSPVSEAYRNMALQLNPKLAGAPGFDQMNAEGIKQLLPMVDLSIKAQVAKDNHQLAMMEKQKSESAKGKADMGKTIQTIMNRGAPMQAQNSILSVDKIMDLFNNKPDPSTWDSSEVHLFRTETEKMAKGGIPSEGGTKALIPPTVASALSSVATGITGDSIGTHQGAMIKNLVPYIRSVRDTSSAYLRDNIYTPVMTSYNRRVTPEDMEDYKKSIPDYIYNQKPTSSLAHGMESKGKVPSSTLQQYAMKHNLSPKAAASLLKNGGYDVEGY